MTDHANELRRYSRKIGQPAGDVPSVMLDAADEIERLAAKLEAAEKERDELLAGLDEGLDKTKWVQQGINEGTISAKYLGLHRADVMTSLLGEAEKERDALRGKAEAVEKNLRCCQAEREEAAALFLSIKTRLTEERDALRAKIAEMEKQEPVVEVQWAANIPNSFLDFISTDGYLPKLGDKLYLASGAQPKLNEIKIALRRALELGKRETWTGAKKYRSREDQCEEQRCWDKVWTLLDAKGE